MDFYITLPSSVESDRNNTSSRYTTLLPETLHLKKNRFVVGLTDIIYPCSYENVPLGTFYTVVFNDDHAMKVIVPAGNYSNWEKLQQALKPQQSSPGVTSGSKSRIRSVEFKYNKTIERFELVLKDSDIKQVILQQNLAYLLGFSKNNISTNTVAERPVDFTNNVNTMYIYCDAVDYSIVGNKKSNLLQCCPLTGSYGGMQQLMFPTVRYLPISKDSIDAIRIELLNEFGQPIPFNWGSTVATLHFKVCDQ